MYSPFLSSSFFHFLYFIVVGGLVCFGFFFFFFFFFCFFFFFFFFFLCLLVVTIAQLHSTKPELRFYTFSHFTKTIYRHHHHCLSEFQSVRETERDRDREWGVRGWGIVNKNALYYPLVSLRDLFR